MVTAFHLGLLVPLLAAGSQADPGPYIHLDRLSPRVALVCWPGLDRRCNLTVIASQKGLVIIDTEASPRLMAPIKKKIEQTFHRTDWTYVINTHAHDNHASGNVLFPGAVIVGHENLVQDMQWLIRRRTDPDRKRREVDRYHTILRDLRAALPRYAANPPYARLIRSDLIFYDLFVQDLQQGYEVVPPALTFSDKHTLDLGDLTLELIFFGKGHSASDILIYVPQERLLVSGAIAYQRYRVPEIGEESHLEDVHRFLAVLDRLLADEVKIEHVIPGHSVPLPRAVLPPIRDYYQRMLKEVAAARQQGLTLDETTKLLTLRAKFPAFRDPPPHTYGWDHQERNVRNLWRILAEDQPAPQPAPAQP
ncbi:MAG: MBL fold metallo-hydrolase [Planctomycetes bacterium]|jgi:glyoxylase-like metal-dependent hydrolase (beta-lactamase superfamily II)|nr:MBL fold metallo-hydrolase [Planctomycetota bacterium]